MSWGYVIAGVATIASSAISSSKSKSKSKNTSEVFQPQVFTDLYQGARQALGRINPNDLQAAAGSLFDAGGNFLSTLMDNASGNSPAGQYLTQTLNDTGLVDEQIGQLQSELGQFFGEQLLPQIQSQAVSAGQLGGGRQGVAQAQGIQYLGDAFTKGVLGIRQADQQRRDNLALNLGQMQTEAAGAGIGALANLYALAQNQTLAPLAPWAAYSDIIGRPTVLGQGSSSSSSSSWSWGGMDFSGLTGTTTTPKKEGS